MVWLIHATYDNIVLKTMVGKSTYPAWISQSFIVFSFDYVK